MIQIEMLDSPNVKSHTSLTDRARAQNALAYAIALHRFPFTRVNFYARRLMVTVENIRYSIDRVKKEPKLMWVLGKLHETP